MQIVDRRLNPGGKSLANRQRFLRRAKDMVRDAVRNSAGERSLKDIERGGEVTIPASGVKEPHFRRAGGGFREHVLPGNKEYLEGDTIPRPPGGGGGGSEGSPDGEGEDAFRFALTQEEFLDLFLEDLELPELAKKRVVEGDASGVRRAGFATQGSPSNLALGRTMRNALSRRLALRRPKPDEVEELEEALRVAEAADPAEAELLRGRIARLKARATRIPYIDPIDVRYRQFEPAPKPIARAVMFCLMDVSGSMTEGMKDLAKRFYLLLHLFLKRRYKHVDVVFIRHTHEAKEVDEETFFRSPETGGTIVSTAFEEMLKVVEARYSPADWNIYVAQASDGDNTTADNERTAQLVMERIVPVCQYFAYLEVGREDDGGPIGFMPRETELWRTYGRLRIEEPRIAMRKVRHRKDIYPVFRDLFRKGAVEGAK
ncbi:YeaH/YhbH family protein [Falsiroseomonas oryziterrae]|uniref:YeaH/YhbH family protein n=1 Tax=Falsiroseomonas oryziterrae TaxID=2911368 RepID=UPI001F48F8A8|nr:YeaH/YhbH family protein [Roseomonas sp. NPKOSM-4]